MPCRVNIMNNNMVAALIIAILVVGFSTVLINNIIKKIDRCNSVGVTVCRYDVSRYEVSR
jgi:hypothetical protein